MFALWDKHNPCFHLSDASQGFLLIPEAVHASFLTHAVDNGEVDVDKMLGSGHDRVRNNPFDKSARDQVVQLCQAVVSREPSATFDLLEINNQRLATEILLDLNEWALAQKGIERLLHGHLSNAVCDALGKAVFNFGLPAVRFL
jgi:hypothetical protein